MDFENKYNIEFTDECKNEMRKIYEYIKNELYSETSAKKLINKVEEFISNLEYAPRIYAELEKFKGTNNIYRRIVINNYIILYTIDEENKIIYIAHMYYSGNDYTNKI